MRTTLFIPAQDTPHFKMRPLTITVKRNLTLLRSTLSKEDFDFFLNTHKIAQNAPKKAYKDAKTLLLSYPYHPEILNLMTYLYLSCHKIKKADKLIVINYNYNPKYLLGKINYADYCIRRRRINEIITIFNQRWDLRDIAPTRTIFHLSEYRSFMVVMSFYQLALKNTGAAEAYFYLAYTVDKSHPSVQILKKKLFFRKNYKN